MTRPREALRVAGAAFLIAFAVLIANGRAIGSGDTHAMERTAGALVERGTFILPEESADDPFTRPVPGGRISIYPALPALLAAPLFALISLLFDLNLNGLQVAGKVSAAFFASAATGVMAWSFARRAPRGRALGAALLFGLGTSAYSTAQALWQHPAVLLFLAVAISALERLERAREPAEPTRAPIIAAIFLALAAASRPAVIPLCTVLFLFLLLRARSRILALLTAGAIPAGLVATYNAVAFGAPWRFGPPLRGRFLADFPESLAGLLVSPGRGLFLFTPIALLALRNLVRASRASGLGRALLLAAMTHFVFMGTWNEWHGGESFGPRLLTDLLPALFFFLPEGLAAWPVLGAGLGLLSVGVQLLGGWTYDYRWERLHQRGQEFDAALWSWSDSPMAFALREGVVIQGIPRLEGRHVALGLRRFTPFGPEGSSVEATTEGLRVSGEARLGDVRLERGARLSEGWMRLAHPADALALRSRVGGVHVLRLIGSLDGILRVETRGAPVSLPTSGDFDLRVPLDLAAGDDVFVRAQSGELRLGRVDLSASGSGS